MEYDATAFHDADGNLQIDAWIAPVSGPFIDGGGGWSPDSFRVDAYGAVAAVDDLSRDNSGWTR